MPTGDGLKPPVVCAPSSGTPTCRLGGGDGLRPVFVRNNVNYGRAPLHGCSA